MNGYSYTSEYMTRNGKPWFPVMGEIHYSRYPKRYWKESLYKMRAGGVEVITSYVIWIHHEEIEKEYDFTGDRDLRTFVKLVEECGMKMLLRIGPWSHGEVRNGGFPDWLLKKSFELRANNPGYLEEVRQFYRKIYGQVEGLLFKDGGPIIGIQIENEYGHAGGMQGEEGEVHMKTLTRIAKEEGFDVPLYTATGWGGAVTGGLLPVMGGYCDAPWDQRLTEIEPSGNYIFTKERNDHNIGSDYGIGYGLTFDEKEFPYLTAELGGGLQVTHHRRPVAHSKDIGAMTLVKLGSGVNLLGYYMYHGGTNPEGKRTTLQETRATGYPNDLPELNYDFRAPIREYGQVSETLKELKLYTMFVRDFGEELCRMPAAIPKENPLMPQDLKHIRYCFRHDGKKGYLFVNNYQRRHSMAEHYGIRFRVPLKEEIVEFPEMDLADGAYFFYPVNMTAGEFYIKTALAAPLCKLANQKETYVFYADHDPAYQVETKEGARVDMVKQGEWSILSEHTQILTLTRKQAKNAWKIIREQEYLFLSDSAVIDEDSAICLFGRKKPSFQVYPDMKQVPEGFSKAGEHGLFTIYEFTRDVQKPENRIRIKSVQETEGKKIYELELSISPGQDDCYVIFSYNGDSAKLYRDGKQIADHFYQGEPWEVSMRRFDFPKKLLLEVAALRKGDARFLEKWPEMKDGVACELEKISMVTEYQTRIRF